MNQKNIDSYLKTNAVRHLDELKEWLRIPSISTHSDYASDVARAAQWLAEHLRAIGFPRVEIIETKGHPLVFAELTGDASDKPTLLIYGHYDVQPVDPIDEWTSGPFEPTVRTSARGEELYARGACDDKGPTFALIKSVETLLNVRGELPVNLKLLIEGEEEVGSPSISQFLRENTELLQADAVLISDTPMLGPDRPSIDYGLRGFWFGELVVRGPSTDLHSGSFGGVVHNPNQALAEILATMHSSDGRVAVDGFYDQVRDRSPKERERLSRLPPSKDELLKMTGVEAVYGEENHSVVERLGTRPTLEINGMWGGYIEQGFKTVIPAEARARLSCRLVPDQDPEQVGRLIEAHIERVSPRTVKTELNAIGGLPAVLLDPEVPAMRAARRAIKKGFGEEPLLNLCGGSIPIVAEFQKRLEVPVVLLGFGLTDDNIHAPDERLHLPNFYRGIRTGIYFFEEITKLK